MECFFFPLGVVPSHTSVGSHSWWDAADLRANGAGIRVERWPPAAQCPGLLDSHVLSSVQIPASVVASSVTVPQFFYKRADSSASEIRRG